MGTAPKNARAKKTKQGVGTLEHVAYHEAGHAVVAAHFGTAEGESVTIVPGEGNLGHHAKANYRGMLTELNAYGVSSFRTWSWVQHSIIELYAGGLAANRFNPEIPPTAGCGGDFEQIAVLASHLAGNEKETAEDDEDGGELDALLEYLRLRTLAVLRRVWPAVEAVAKALLERSTLRGDEVVAIMHKVKVRSRVFSDADLESDAEPDRSAGGMIEIPAPEKRKGK